MDSINIKIGFLIIFIICLVMACDNTDDQNQFSLPYQITCVEKDTNNDGIQEKILISLTKGHKINENEYKGKFEIKLLDNQNNIIASLPINEKKDIVLPQDFEILFKDYTNNDVLDFNIGYKSYNGGQYYYKFYTLDDIELKEIIFEDDSCLISYYEGNSYDFSADKTGFTSYMKLDDNYLYQYYCLDEGVFSLHEEIIESINYEDVNEKMIEDKLNEFANIIDLENYDINIIELNNETYNWVDEHYEELKLYLFMNKHDNPVNQYIEFLEILVNKFNDIDQLLCRFYGLGIKDFRKLNLDEFVNKFKIYNENNEIDKLSIKRYNWRVQGKNYNLAIGRNDMNKFVILYNEQGQYLDNCMWLDKECTDPIVCYYSKQNSYSIKPINMGTGSGHSLNGEIWFQVHKNRLISDFEVLLYGHDYYGYNHGFRNIDNNYDEETGNYQITYKIGIKLNDEIIGIDKTVDYTWNLVDECFVENDDNNIYDEMFENGIEDKILRDNLAELKEVMNNDDYYEEDLIRFLNQCSGDERHEFLLLIKD